MSSYLLCTVRSEFNKFEHVQGPVELREYSGVFLYCSCCETGVLYSRDPLDMFKVVQAGPHCTLHPCEQTDTTENITLRKFVGHSEEKYVSSCVLTSIHAYCLHIKHA